MPIEYIFYILDGGTMCEENRDSVVGVFVLRGRQAQGIVPRMSAAQDVGYSCFISYHITGILSSSLLHTYT